jgi:GDP-L-fucose synthase
MRVLVLGATGFVGQHVVKKLALLHPECQIVESSLTLGCDLRDQHQTKGLFERVLPTHVINCAAYVGGIQFGYDHAAEIFSNNMRMIVNVFDAALSARVARLVQPISNCAYPAAETFFQEKNFWNGPLHESVLVYGMTRKMMWTAAFAYARQYRFDCASLVVSNMYGPGDHFDPVRSHALGGLIQKIVTAKRERMPSIEIWGTGKPIREWLYVEDGAESLVRGLTMPQSTEIVNIGSGVGVSITELASMIREAVGWDGDFIYATDRPDGAPHKRVDGARGASMLGWKPSTELRFGIQCAVEDYFAVHQAA